MKKVVTILIISVFALPSAWAHDWDINQDFVSIGIADQGWTIDEKYTGIKGLIDARYTLNCKTGEVQQAPNQFSDLFVR